MKFLLSFLILASLGFSGCMSVEPLVVKSVTCCDLKKATKSETAVGLQVEMSNPNDFPITVKSYDLGISVSGNAIGNAKSNEPTVIPAKGTVEKAVSITTSTSKLVSGSLMMGLQSLLGNAPSKLEIQIEGAVVGKAKGLSMRVKIKEKYPLDMKL
ncbi:MAG: LEA type 2 family protein [Flavobacteriales bacterium]